MTWIVYTLGFLIFDREAGRVRPSAVTGLIVVVLAVAGHVWLSGPWLRQAGFADVPHPASAAVSTQAP